MSELLLQTRNLTKQYGRHRAVDDVNMHIKKGAISVSYTHLDVYKRQVSRPTVFNSSSIYPFFLIPVSLHLMFRLSYADILPRCV